MRSERQIKSQTRNWHLRQLRAFFHLVPPPVSKEVKEQIQRLVDQEIINLGGESEIYRQSKRFQESIEEIVE